MKYGIYYAYWEKEWGGQFVPYVEKCRRLGFDILEVACGAFHLEEAGFFVETAPDGTDAVAMVEQTPPGYYDVVLMDVQMPVMNGYEAATRIRQMEDKALSSIPILAMTANAFEEDKKEALKCGMNGHIAKPIDVNTLLETLDRMLD